MLNTINTELVASCPLCGDLGNLLYEELEDLVFGAPGKWSIRKCSNPGCELYWSSPRPIASDLHKAYHTYYTHNGDVVRKNSKFRNLVKARLQKYTDFYIKRRFGYVSAGEISIKVLDFLANLLPSGADALAIQGMFLPACGPRKLLEIGCGNGNLLEKMRRFGWNVSGVEYDPACANLTEKHGIQCQLGDVREQNYPPESFSAIFTGNVIEHVLDPCGFVSECFRVLEGGGRLVIVTPNALSLGHQYFKKDWRGLEPPRHFQIFDVRNLTTLLNDAGFEVEVARTTNRGAWYILGMSRLIKIARERQSTVDNSKVKLISALGMTLQIAGRLAHIFYPRAGEELIFIAQKKSTLQTTIK